VCVRAGLGGSVDGSVGGHVCVRVCLFLDEFHGDLKCLSVGLRVSLWPEAALSGVCAWACVCICGWV